MGGTPKKPPPLNQMPKSGFDDSQFPFVGKGGFQPRGDYRSQINAAPPLDAGAMKRIGDVTQPRSMLRDASAGNYGSLAGQLTLGAWNRSMAGTATNALMRASDAYNKQYQAQAEKSRADDILAQRQNTFDRWRKDLFVQMFGADTAQHFESEIESLAAYYEREKKNAAAQVAASALGMLGGLL